MCVIYGQTGRGEGSRREEGKENGKIVVLGKLQPDLMGHSGA